MMKFHPKYFSGIVAVSIYFGIISLVFFYFGYHTKEKKIHYVAKNSHAIAVTLQAPSKQKKTRHKRKASPARPQPKKVHHSKPKPITTVKKSKPKPKPKKAMKKPAKKVQAKSLFSHIKSAPKSQQKSKPEKAKIKPIQKSAKASGKKSNDALKRQKARDKGIENRYRAGVEDKLYGWPTQSNFAGARFTIGLTIYPSGKFEYVVLTPSANPEFNRTLRQYLSQLKGIGFDPTPKGEKYEFKVEIVAK